MTKLSLNIVKELLLLELVVYLFHIELLNWLSDGSGVISDILRSGEVRDRGSREKGSGLMLRERVHSSADGLASHVRVAIKNQ